MEWLLIIVLFSSTEDIDHAPVRFETQPECIAAAEAFVRKFPAFEFRDRSDKRAVETPVIRSYVECIPKPSG
ncbi:MAG TPA: hypothetical protein ENI79_03735 [Rhodospirillales bacterium]|nr:hypothetical protein [Rhodospirillales bacterium]